MPEYRRRERVEPKKKRSLLKIFLSILLVLFMLGIILFVYLYIKLNGLTDEIHNPLDRGEHSEHRDEALDYNSGEPMSIAIFGIDSDSERDEAGGGERSDAIMLLSVNPEKEKTVLVSIPRDTRTEIVGAGSTEKINHAYAYGGPQMAIDTLEQFMDVPVDHYMSMDMDGVHELVDDVHGVDVESNGSFTVKGTEFVKGETYHMDGDTALKFMRSRYEEGSGGDSGRQERQQLVLEALAHDLLSVGSVTRINSIFETLGDNVETDLTIGEMQKFALKYRKGQNNIEKLQLEGEDMVLDDGLWYFIPNDESFNRVQRQYTENLNQ